MRRLCKGRHIFTRVLLPQWPALSCCRQHVALNLHVYAYLATVNSSYANSSDGKTDSRANGGGILKSRTVAEIVANNTPIAAVVVVVGDFVDAIQMRVCTAHIVVAFVVCSTIAIVIKLRPCRRAPLSSMPPPWGRRSGINSWPRLKWNVMKFISQ